VWIVAIASSVALTKLSPEAVFPPEGTISFSP
jgi:hypothetical protein